MTERKDAPSPPPPVFGALLRSYREIAGLSQEQLAERSGVSAKAIGALERSERRRPYPHTLDLLVKALDLGANERRTLVAAAVGSAVPPTTGDHPVPSPLDAGRLSVDRLAAKHNLPAPLSSFVGRAAELAEITRLLPTTRLFTLTGSGGCGKTRLALQVGVDLLPDYPDGVWLVELAPIADPDLVAPTVATVLGIQSSANRPLLNHLVDVLRSRRLLLLLDNCEHLLDASARLADAILRGCLSIHLLATSREALRISGEVSWRVPSLAFPPADPLPPIPDLVQIEAVHLFLDRANAVRPGFALTSQNAPAVVQICRRLDGIPLALELAAARLRGLSAEQLAARLDQRFRLLTEGSRAALPRQQTLAAAVAWSYDLLTPAEQTLFNRLAVFLNGFTLEAAEAIGSDTQHPILADDVVALLLRLVEKSLVVAEPGEDGVGRYRLLETLRQYAMEKLAASGEAASARQRHGAYYLTLAAPPGERPTLDSNSARARLVIEYDNFRAALRWFADAGDWEGCLRLIGSLALEWTRHGYQSERIQWIDAVLRHKDDVSPTTCALGLTGAGVLAFGRGDMATALAAFRESASSYQSIGDKCGSALALYYLGSALRDQGDLPQAEATLEEALREGRSGGDQNVADMTLYQIGLLARQKGDLPRAEMLLNEILQLVENDAGRPGLLGQTLYNLGLVAEDQNHLTRARELYERGIAFMRKAERHWQLSFVLEGFASVASRQDQMERTLVLAGAAASARERLGNPIPPAMKARLDRAVAAAREQLGEAAATAAWDAGRAMTMDRAIAYAREEEATRL